RRYNQDRLELHAGLMLLLGPMIDRPRTAWEEGFIPEALARWMATITVDGKPLVGQSETLYASRRHDAPENPAPQWGAYGLFSLLLSLLVAVALRFEPGFWSLLPWRIAVLSTGLSGVLVLLMWFGTSHEAVDG